jgi:hypothetical protein
MKPDEVTHGMFMDTLRPPGQKLEGGWPKSGSVWMCMNDEKFREDLVLERMIGDVVDRFELDAAYLDIHTPLPCGNPRHGCAPMTVPVEGNIAFLESFKRRMERKGTSGKVFAGHCGWAFNSAYTLMDYTLPGEFDFNVPNTTMLNTVWTSLLFGIQCQFYTGEMDVSSPHFYQAVLSRASLAYAWLMPRRFTRDEQKMWVKYMTPLKIYDVEDSVLHHPFDGDYTDVAKVDRKEVFGIVYRRPGDVFLVVTTEGQNAGGTVQVTLKTDALALQGDVLIHDVHSGGLVSRSLKPGEGLTLDIELDEGPSMLRVFNQPEKPMVFWHDPVVWHIPDTKNSQILTVGGNRNLAVIDSVGVPLGTGKLLLWCGDLGKPKDSGGVNRIDFDEETRVATLWIEFDERAKNRARLSF